MQNLEVLFTTRPHSGCSSHSLISFICDIYYLNLVLNIVNLKKKKKANLAVAYFFSRSKFFGFCLYSLVPIENFIKEKKISRFQRKVTNKWDFLFSRQSECNQKRLPLISSNVFFNLSFCWIRSLNPSRIFLHSSWALSLASKASSCSPSNDSALQKW